LVVRTPVHGTHIDLMIGNTKKHASLAVFGLALSLYTSSCVSQQQYDDAVSLAKHHQTTLHEREQYIAQLESERDQLKRQLAMDQVTALSNAGYGDDIDSRLSELQQKINGLGRPLNDIERFDVEGGYVLMVQDKILFDLGSSELSTAGKDAVAKVAAEIESRPHGRVWVRGHTDSTPMVKASTKERYPHGNLELSAARAIEVAAALIGSGKVQQKDVAVAGFGPHDPVKPNDNPDNKRMNRRVEIFVADAK